MSKKEHLAELAKVDSKHIMPCPFPQRKYCQDCFGTQLMISNLSQFSDIVERMLKPKPEAKE